MAANPNPPALPPWQELHDDITANILRRLSDREVLESAMKVCRQWRRVCIDPSMWQVINMSNPGYIRQNCKPFQLMCRRAINLSEGQLVDLRIKNFGSFELLFYIGERCNNLRRLTLEGFYISRKGLIKALKKFPELEELHLHLMTFITDKEIEKIGKCCPKLKSFSYHSHNDLTWDLYCNSNALAVARNMPNLQRLDICGTNMNNEILEAILNGCQNLESLYIDGWFSDIDLSGDLEKRCWQRLKFLRCPGRDYHFDYGYYVTYN